MRTTKTVGWSLGTAGLCVAVTAGSWFGVVGPERAEAAEARESTVAAQATNSQLVVKIEQLEREFADLPTRQAELAAVRQALPEDVALATLLRQLQDQATDAGVVLDAVTAEAPVAVVDPAASPVAPPPAEGEPSTAPSAEPSAAPADGGTAAEGAQVPPAVVDPATQPILAAVPVVITTTGDLSQTTLVLKNIQARMPRAFLVDSLGLAPSSEGSVAEGGATSSDRGLVTATITGRVFAFVDPTAVDIAGPGGTVPGPAATAVPSAEPSDG